MTPREAREQIAGMTTEGAVYAGNGLALRYRLFTPDVKPGQKYPLVLFLHGMGERGHDNLSHIVNTGGAHYWAAKEIQEKTPCYIAAPQCPDELSWTHEGMPEILMRLVRSLCDSEQIDPMRLCVTGLSMGGIGTWNLIAKYPRTFAAAMPICGAAAPEVASKVGSTPLWAFHAIDDPIVPAAGEMHSKTLASLPPIYGSKLSVAAALRAGSRDVRYTEYPAGYIPGKWGHGHASWEEAYRDDEAREWMLSRNRLDIYDATCVTPGVYEIADSVNDSFYIIEGRDRALAIDTGMARGDIIKLVESVTRLPYALALTHGHGDHSMHCARFDRVYLDMADRDMLYSARFDGQRTPDEARLCGIKGGDEIDLGGGVVIKAVALPGHTPGSLLFVDELRKCVFTGDAVGSGCGVWMQVPTGSPLSEYAESCKNAARELREIGVTDSGWAFLGGHAAQRYQSSVSGYNPVSLELIDDMAILCEKVVSGEIEGGKDGVDERASRFGDVLFARYQKAEMLYTRKQIK